MKHYVYKLEDSNTKEFYFGSRSYKGKPGDDPYKGSMKTWIPKDKDSLIKIILRDDFRTRDEALKYERSLIKEHINDGLNRNYHIPTERHYNFYVSNDVSGEKNPMYGKKRSEEWKKKQSKRMVEFYKKHPDRTNRGSKWNIESKRKQSRTRIERKLAVGKNNNTWIGYCKITDLDGNEYSYETTTEAALVLGVDRSYLVFMCKTNSTYRRGKYKGWIFEITQEN